MIEAASPAYAQLLNGLVGNHGTSAKACSASVRRRFNFSAPMLLHDELYWIYNNNDHTIRCNANTTQRGYVLNGK